ncbi:kinase-like domain-containing protein [Xylariaceae sp. FL0255]|nr:kinase-like domain-containing protein [Xylariaceae sp. FL0255]
MNFGSPPPKLRASALQEPSFKRAQQIWKELNDRFGVHSYVKYQKVLGFGGFGMVQQWSTFNLDGTKGEDIAVKGTTDDAALISGLQDEIYWTKIFKNSEHLMQLRDIPLHPSTIDLYEKLLTRDISVWQNNENHPQPVMVMEVMRHGALAQLIHRVSTARTYYNPRTSRNEDKLVEFIPNRILWRLLLCMVRSCLGMAFPEPTNVPQQPSGSAMGIIPKPPLYREEFRSDIPPRPIVHFDLDVQNVFLGEIDISGVDQEHNVFPISKIADYGLMVYWQDSWTLVQKDMYSSGGKAPYKAPEHLSRGRLNEAGIYGPQTNVWGVGLTLFSCITLTFDFDNAPGASKGRTLSGSGRYITTYGHALLGSPASGPLPASYADVDLELRETVARCLHSNHLERPKLDELLKICLRNIASDDRYAPASAPAPAAGQPNREYELRPRLGQVESNALLWRFTNDYFLNAAPPQDAYEPHWRNLLPKSDLDWTLVQKDGTAGTMTV